MTDIKEFVRERNEVLFSLDQAKILRYYEKWGIPKPPNEKVFWGAVYKAICNIPDAPEELVEKAKNWLGENGMSTKIG